MNLTVILAFLIAPVIALILTVMASRILNKQHLTQFISSFILGVFMVVPMIVGLWAADYYALMEDTRSLRRYLFFSFLIVGFLGEFSKFVLLRFYFIPKEGITKPFDGILYSVMISMGFATAANIYLFLAWPPPFNLPIVFFTIPIANLIIGIILGFFVGMGKFRKQHVDDLTGLAAAIFFHGFYIFCILAYDYVLLGLVGFVTLIIAVLLSVRSLNTDVRQMM